MRVFREWMGADHDEGELSHLDAAGRAKMVNVGEKDVTRRVAVAAARVLMKPTTFDLLMAGKAPKGDVMAAARIAGIQAAKRTWELIPLCHQLALTSCAVEIEALTETSGVEVSARVEARDKTGVEMEALTAASIAALTLYDMLKAVARGIEIERVRLLEKSGGQSGDYRASSV